MPTIYEIAKTIKQTKNGASATNASSIAAGMKPETFDARQGLRTLTPAQLLSLTVPTLARSNGGFDGFQRDTFVGHARKIAAELATGTPMPVLEVSLLPDGTLWLGDGQHRAIGAIIAGASLDVVIRKLSADHARLIFTNQGRARRVNPNVTILSARDPFSEYVQDALTSVDHPWSDLVGQNASANRISAKQMLDAIANYSGNRLGQNPLPLAETFSADRCDEMGTLLAAFGTKQTNPTAFRPSAVKAITAAAVLAIRRPGSRREDLDRWARHMPQFTFAAYQHLRRETELTDALLAHWNKRLSTDHRVSR